MHQYKIIARILVILSIINFTFAFPIAVQETRQVCDDVVPDVAIAMSAKRGDEVELSGKPDSDLAVLKGLQPEAPDHGSMDPQMGTSEIQRVSPELSKSPSFDHYLESPASEASLDHYLASDYGSLESEGSFASAGDSLASTNSESGSSSSLSIEEFKPKSFLSKVVSKISKLKFWRRISGPSSGRDDVSAAQRSG